jgi:hypothetical protein
MWVHTLLERSEAFTPQSYAIKDWWSELRDIVTETPKKQVELHSRAVMTRIVDIVQGLLLIVDALSDGDEIARLVMEAWFAEKQDGASLKTRTPRKDQTRTDLRIVFGSDRSITERPKL